MKIGVLALQGDFDAHRQRLEELGAEVVLVRKPEQLDEIDGLVLPGGESSTILRLLGEQGFQKLGEFVRSKPAFGTCAGAILLAAEVQNPSQKGLGAIDITVRVATPTDARSIRPSSAVPAAFREARSSRSTFALRASSAPDRRRSLGRARWAPRAGAPGKEIGRHVSPGTLWRHARPPGISQTATKRRRELALVGCGLVRY